MFYEKSKREKRSICNLCRKASNLTWDHIPPKGGIQPTTVQMETIVSLMTRGNESRTLPQSQGGMKYRTLCGNCNSYLGASFDPTINDFASSVGRYLTSSIALPDSITHKVKPQRLMKAILGHLVAAKIEIEDTLFDEAAREYVLDINAHLPAEINIFYWIYPYDCSMAIREFLLFTPRGTYNEPAMFQALKYFPMAYLCCDKPEYDGLDNLSWYREAGIDDEIEISINLKRSEHPYWPEAPSKEENNILFGGASLVNSIHATPRR